MRLSPSPPWGVCGAERALSRRTGLTDDAAALLRPHLAADRQRVRAEALDDALQDRLGDSTDDGGVAPRERIERAVPEADVAGRISIGIEAELLGDVFNALEEA